MTKHTIPDGSLISYFSNIVKQHGGINLAQGLPGFPPPDKLLLQLSKNASKPVHQYAPGSGNINLVEQITKHYNISSENLLITNGATEAISLLYIYLSQKIKEQFSVLAFEPVYESYSNLPEIFDDKFISHPLIDNITPDFHNLEQTIVQNNVKIIFLCSPGNPYGKIWTKSELDRLITITRKYNCYLIFDAVYKDIYFDQPPAIPKESPKEHIFYVNSFSKMLSITGWRIGYLISHTSHMEKIRKIHDYTGLSSPSILQQTIADYLNESAFAKDYLISLRKKIHTSYKLMHKTLINLEFTIPKADGGYFIWCKLPKRYENGFKFALDLYTHEKVAVVPGIHFSQNAQPFIRINCAQPTEFIEKASEKIRNFLR